MLERERPVQRPAVALPAAEHLDESQIAQGLDEHPVLAERLGELDRTFCMPLRRLEVAEHVADPGELLLERDANANVCTRLVERPLEERRRGPAVAAVDGRAAEADQRVRTLATGGRDRHGLLQKRHRPGRVAGRSPATPGLEVAPAQGRAVVRRRALDRQLEQLTGAARRTPPSGDPGGGLEPRCDLRARAVDREREMTRRFLRIRDELRQPPVEVLPHG